jgi:hypothetical protein
MSGIDFGKALQTGIQTISLTAKQGANSLTASVSGQNLLSNTGGVSGGGLAQLFGNFFKAMMGSSKMGEISDNAKNKAPPTVDNIADQASKVTDLLKQLKEMKSARGNDHMSDSAIASLKKAIKQETDKLSQMVEDNASGDSSQNPFDLFDNSSKNKSTDLFDNKSQISMVLGFQAQS